MQGSVHVKGFVYFYTSSGRISKGVGYSTSGRSSVRDLNTRTDVSRAKNDAIANAVSRAIYFYNSKSDVMYDYDFELTESKVVMYGKVITERKQYVKKDVKKRYTRSERLNEMDKPVTREQANKELGVRDTSRYKAKTKRKSTFKSVESYRKEKRAIRNEQKIPR